MVTPDAPDCTAAGEEAGMINVTPEPDKAHVTWEAFAKNLAVTGYWLLVIGYWLLVIGYCSSINNY
jgi:hypothetical protein